LLGARVKTIEKRVQELESLLADQAVLADFNRWQGLSREYQTWSSVLTRFTEYESLERESEKAKEILETAQDPELKELAEKELADLENRKQTLKREIFIRFLPRNIEKNCIVEIRAAAGGAESSLFVASLFRMYSKFIEKKHWRLELLSTHPTELGGFKEVIFSVEGNGPFRYLRFESGVHRVQRIPVTEASGRIHTSTVTVAVLPEAKEVEFKINPDELKIEVFRASGHGGQHVNVTDSAVRITHIPTGISISCQDERSQHRNKAKAMKILRARLFELKRQEEEKKIAQTRRQQVGSGERSEKIRTYNFPQNRLTDHRIDLTLYNMKDFLEGDLDSVVTVLEDKEIEKVLEDKFL
jgi:peptide chain release factor 1